MKLRLVAVPVILCSFVSAQAAADSISVSLSNDTAYAEYGKPLEYSAYGRTDLEIGVMNTDSKDLMATVGIAMIGEVGSQAPGLQFGLTIKGYAISFEESDYDVAAITLGAKAWFVPPQASRIGVVVHGNYAPAITTYADAETLWEAGIRAEYEVLPGAAMFMGYRRVSATLEGQPANNSDIDMDEGGHMGLRMTF